MASDFIQLSGLTGRYATALFELAEEAKAIDTVATDALSLLSMLADSEDLRRMTTAQHLSRSVQSGAILALADKAEFSDIVRRFLGVVASNRRLAFLEGILKDFNRLVAAYRGEINADIWSAHTLTKKQRDALTKKLKLAMGQDVKIQEKIDESLIGGLVIKVGSLMVDSSIKTKLANLKVAMKGVQ